MDVSHQIRNILNKNKWTADLLTCPDNYMFFFRNNGPAHRGYIEKLKEDGRIPSNTKYSE
jgi:hypothetical protein